MTATPGASVSDRIAHRLADPDTVLRRRPQPVWWRQSLANGALGVALLHIEHARTGHTSWNTANAWLQYVTSGPIDDGPGSHLHYGAPALGFVLHRAAAAHPAGDLDGVLATLDARVAALTRLRLDQAHRRIDTGEAPALAEFDTLRGLAGLGAYWLTRHDHAPDADSLVPAVATYLVRLTEPLAPAAGRPAPADGLPGWWTPLAPSGRPSSAFPDGHVNHGLAHGIGGPLALLALTAIAGLRVTGHDGAIGRILACLDQNRHTDDTGTWWPYWTTPRHPGHGRQGRPSWCYGSPGLARAHQLAGIALRDDDLRAVGSSVITGLPLDTRPALRDASLCHGHTGLLHLAGRIADASNPRTAGIDVLGLHANAVDAAERQHDEPNPAFGLLEGLPGTGLVLAAHDGLIDSGWDRCLLIS